MQGPARREFRRSPVGIRSSKVRRTVRGRSLAAWLETASPALGNDVEAGGAVGTAGDRGAEEAAPEEAGAVAGEADAVVGTADGVRDGAAVEGDGIEAGDAGGAAAS
jgi:hypothetical protein